LRAAIGAALAVVAITSAAAGCGSSGHPHDGGGVDGKADGAQTCGHDGGTTGKMNGQACSCAGECQSGFCVDGVCCNTSCTETCKSCDVQGSPGTCSFVPAGAAPREASLCPASDVSTCGLDGTCDGAGACRNHVAGTVCKAGSCDVASVIDVNVCDGKGRCKPGPTTICAPFDCDPTTGACVVTCKTDMDCVTGVACVNGSCGAKPRGAVCTKDSECASGFCTDGVCCSTSCHGPCVSCAQTGRAGTCWPVDLGTADPHNVCRDQGPASCGQTGACDGLGGCSLYVAETVCVAPACSGDRLNTAGTCDGVGSCRPPGVRGCAPYRCVDGACISHCAGDADCVAGQFCQNGSCGPKSNGSPCSGPDECTSGFCVDGVCCADACGGACRSCALPSSMGKCEPLPAGSADPRNVCIDKGASSCGTNGKCDGAAGCDVYQPGTVCAAEHCDTNVYTPASVCTASGACVAPDAVPCAPFACNGTRCFGACTIDDNCSAGNVCSANSCGLKPNGAFCGDRKECSSANCAQGVCCATPCSSVCKSCALPTTMGLCTNVGDGGPDPAGTCLDAGAATCGTNGRCQAGACQSYALGTPCQPASCPSGMATLTPASSCDGAGTCVTPPQTTCFPFRCGTAACKSVCTADADCAPPGSCSAGSCGLKPDGAICGDGTECLSGICAQGACCHTACTGSCVSCALAGSAGACTAIAAGGVDPAGQCRDQGAPSCGTNGFCNGAGSCQLYAAGTECAPPTCPGGSTTATLSRMCDGAGSCKAAVTQSCVPYTCNGMACRAACTQDSDCSGTNVCNAGSCGKKRLGQICGAAAECDSGNCVDGVCCSAPSCGNCASCNVSGTAGACTPVPAGAAEPHGLCQPAPPCGTNGTCDGNGGCRFMAVGTACGAASCSGSMSTPVGMCDGAGTCKQTSINCSPYVCGGNACKTTCATTADCVSGYSCLGYFCTNLQANGAACTSPTQCISGHCTEGFCCGVAACPACNSCAVTGKQGTCAPAGDGTVCSASSCDGNDRYHPPGVCAAGSCAQGALVSCAPWGCNAAAATGCNATCASDGDCAKKNKCTVTAGVGVCGP
jgi:hypothetical protein